MALTLALNSTPGTIFSDTAALTSPLNLTFDGILGGEKEVQLLLKNTGSSSVTISKIEATNLILHSNHIESVEFKINSEDAYTSSLTSLSITLDANATQSFYMKTKAYAGSSVTNIKDIGLKVTY